MRKTNRIISLLVLICFLFNTALSDLAFSQPLEYTNIDKLAASSRVDDIGGVQLQDIARIMFNLEWQLKILAGEDKAININTLVKKANQFEDSIYKARIEFENPVQLFTHEIRNVSGNYYSVMCRVKDDKHGLRTYYAVFSTVKDEQGGFPIEAYTKEKWEELEKSIKSPKDLPKRQTQKPESAKAIERYIEHEKNIDAWIAYKMGNEDEHFAISPTDIASNSIYREAIHIKRMLSTLGIKNTDLILQAMEKRNLIFIHANEDELPEIHISDLKGVPQKIKVLSHTSNNAIYIMLNDEEWNEFQSVIDKKLYMINAKSFLSKAMGSLLYELGPICGLISWAEEKDDIYVVYNDLVKLSELMFATLYQGETLPDEAKELREKLKDIKPVNLDENLIDRDYATGKGHERIGEGELEILKTKLGYRIVILKNKNNITYSILDPENQLIRTFELPTNTKFELSPNGRFILFYYIRIDVEDWFPDRTKFPYDDPMVYDITNPIKPIIDLYSPIRGARHFNYKFSPDGRYIAFVYPYSSRRDSVKYYDVKIYDLHNPRKPILSKLATMEAESQDPKKFGLNIEFAPDSANVKITSVGITQTYPLKKEPLTKAAKRPANAKILQEIKDLIGKEKIDILLIYAATKSLNPDEVLANADQYGVTKYIDERYLVIDEAGAGGWLTLRDGKWSFELYSERIARDDKIEKRPSEEGADNMRQTHRERLNDILKFELGGLSPSDKISAHIELFRAGYEPEDQINQLYWMLAVEKLSISDKVRIDAVLRSYNVRRLTDLLELGGLNRLDEIGVRAALHRLGYEPETQRDRLYHILKFDLNATSDKITAYIELFHIGYEQKEQINKLNDILKFKQLTASDEIRIIAALSLGPGIEELKAALKLGELDLLDEIRIRIALLRWEEEKAGIIGKKRGRPIVPGKRPEDVDLGGAVVEPSIKDYISKNLQKLLDLLPKGVDSNEVLNILAIWKQDNMTKEATGIARGRLNTLGITEATINKLFKPFTMGTLPRDYEAEKVISFILPPNTTDIVAQGDSILTYDRKQQKVTIYNMREGKPIDGLKGLDAYHGYKLTQRHLLIWDSNSKLTVYDLKTGKPIDGLMDLEVHPDYHYNLTQTHLAIWNPNYKLTILYDLKTGKPIDGLKGLDARYGYKLTQTHLLVLDSKFTVTVYDLKTGKPIDDLKGIDAYHGYELTQTHLLTHDTFLRVTIYDLKTEKPIHGLMNLEADPDTGGDGYDLTNTHLLICKGNFNVTIYDLKTGKPIDGLKGLNARYGYKLTQTHLLICDSKFKLTVYDLRTGKPIDGLMDLEVHPDYHYKLTQTHLLVRDYNSKLTVYDLKTGKPIDGLKGLDANDNYYPNLTRAHLLIRDYENKPIVYDLESGRKIPGLDFMPDLSDASMKVKLTGDEKGMLKVTVKPLLTYKFAQKRGKSPEEADLAGAVVEPSIKDYISANLKNLPGLLPKGVDPDQVLDILAIWKENLMTEEATEIARSRLLALDIPEATINNLFKPFTMGTLPGDGAAGEDAGEAGQNIEDHPTKQSIDGSGAILQDFLTKRDPAYVLNAYDDLTIGDIVEFIILPQMKEEQKLFVERLQELLQRHRRILSPLLSLEDRKRVGIGVLINQTPGPSFSTFLTIGEFSPVLGDAGNFEAHAPFSQEVLIERDAVSHGNVFLLKRPIQKGEFTARIGEKLQVDSQALAKSLHPNLRELLRNDLPSWLQGTVVSYQFGGYQIAYTIPVHTDISFFKGHIMPIGAGDLDKHRSQGHIHYLTSSASTGNTATDVNIAKAALEIDKGDDYFIRPTIVEENAIIRPGDSVIMFNFRGDRAEPMLRILDGDPDFKHWPLEKLNLSILPFGVYNDKYFKARRISGLLDDKNYRNTLGEVLASHGRKQVRIAESEKFKHVTWFFDGLRDLTEEDLPGLVQILVPSNKLERHDEMPEMKVEEIARRAIPYITGEGQEKVGFAFINFANMDIVGHFDNFEAGVKAALAVDKQIGLLMETVQKAGGVLIVTADHGSGERMAKLDEEGNLIKREGKIVPHRAHAFDNKVPFVVVGAGALKFKDGGSIRNIAPTILELMGIEKPKEMDAESLLDGYRAGPVKGPVVLVVRDGWGVNKFDPQKQPEAFQFDATYQAKLIAQEAGIPFYADEILKFPHTELWAHGEHIGHPSYQMGDSENGHFNIGAGRIAESSLAILDKMLANDDFVKTPAVRKVLDNAKKNGGRLHLIGMVSEGGVHSHIEHLLKLLTAISKEEGIKDVVLQAIFDGRDVETTEIAGWQSLERIKQHVLSLPNNFAQKFRIGSIAGRFYPMDRDALNRDKKNEPSEELWRDRVLPWYEAVVYGNGRRGADLIHQRLETSDSAAPQEGHLTEEEIAPMRQWIKDNVKLSPSERIDGLRREFFEKELLKDKYLAVRGALEVVTANLIIEQKPEGLEKSGVIGNVIHSYNLNNAEKVLLALLLHPSQGAGDDAGRASDKIQDIQKVGIAFILLEEMVRENRITHRQINDIFMATWPIRLVLGISGQRFDETKTPISSLGKSLTLPKQEKAVVSKGIQAWARLVNSDRETAFSYIKRLNDLGDAIEVANMPRVEGRAGSDYAMKRDGKGPSETGVARDDEGSIEKDNRKILEFLELQRKILRDRSDFTKEKDGIIIWSDGKEDGFRARFDLIKKVVEITAEDVGVYFKITLSKDKTFIQKYVGVASMGGRVEEREYDGIAFAGIGYDKVNSTFYIIVKDEAVPYLKGLTDWEASAKIGTIIVTPESEFIKKLNQPTTNIIMNKSFLPVLQAPTTSTETDEINTMIDLASKAGLEIPTSENTRYTMLLPFEFFADKAEFDMHKLKYGDRFNLDRVGGDTFERLVNNILSKAVKDRTAVLLPDTFRDQQALLERLKAAGVRFILVNTKDVLLSSEYKKDEYREKFQLDTYVIMLLARRIDENIAKDTSIYRLFSFYLKSHFAFDGIAVEDYINAIKNGDIAKLIRGILSYKPTEPYQVPDYEKVAAALVSA